jgi:hypothetical protein
MAAINTVHSYNLAQVRSYCIMHIRVILAIASNLFHSARNPRQVKAIMTPFTLRTREQIVMDAMPSQDTNALCHPEKPPSTKIGDAVQLSGYIAL